MVGVSFYGRVSAVAATTGFLVVSVLTPARAQRSGGEVVKIHPSAADAAAVRNATSITRHARAANTERGRAARLEELATRDTAPNAEVRSARREESESNGLILRYPADLTYQGGKVVDFAQSHAIYFDNGNCSNFDIAMCWGDPQGFLRDLGRSEFIHVTDQYVGRGDDERYTVGGTAYGLGPNDFPAPSFGTTKDGVNIYSDVDVAIAAASVAFAIGETGYDHIYHLFLPPGADVCFSDQNGNNSNVCYSPDNLKTWVFCAYHGSATFGQGGPHVLFSIEPYQNVLGCQVKPGTPNGELVDSADNVLSHETIETITDPDPGSGWWNNSGSVLSGAEIGDECVYSVAEQLNGKPAYYFDPSILTLGKHTYAIQLEYSNARHACASR